ncbi:hypothetical protein [Runella sp.]|jgi:hypothetical protein|uniref:hypothetical protein n=1 Tax=Runella sp. TaxID=1960881 RepID=UPI00301865F1
MKKKIFILFLLPFWLQGQSTKPPKDTILKVVGRAPEPWMQWQVKHVSEWIDRYNHLRLPDGTTFTDSSRLLYPREQYVRGLFNTQDARLQKGAKGLYRLMVDEFVEQSCGKPPILIGTQPALYADAPCIVQLGGKTDTLHIYLQKVYAKNSAAQWVVEGVKLPKMLKTITPIATKDTIKRHYVEPTAQEVAFLPVLRSLVDAHSILRIAADSLQYHKDLLILESALRDKKLAVEIMLPPTLYLDTQRGWMVQLNDFIRETENSGWLITNLYIADNRKQWPKYLQQAKK